MPKAVSNDAGDGEWTGMSDDGGSSSASDAGNTSPPGSKRRRRTRASRSPAGDKRKGLGNGKRRVWNPDEQVALCKAYKVVSQRTEKGSDWTKEGMWEAVKVDFSARERANISVSDRRGRWGSQTAVPMQTHFERTIAPDVQRFAHYLKLASDKNLMGGLNEEDLVQAAAGLYSGITAYQAVRRGAVADDERERQGLPRAERAGHHVTCACIFMWRELRELDMLRGAAANADAVADRFYGIGGRDTAEDGGGEQPKSGRGKRVALQARPDMGVKAAKRLRMHQEQGQAGGSLLDAEIVRSRKSMEAMVAEAAKRTGLEKVRMATEFFSLPGQQGTSKAQEFMAAMSDNMFNMGMGALSTPSATAAAARTGTDAPTGARGATAGGTNTTAAETATAGGATGSAASEAGAA
eukprot:TRINITY_DN367_c0_g1_i1.p1 TRINITY_DN367_c0_g1~~TRINITY_DN367_c0_g1_i1.p1  ORF type:complete len:409 (-),score=96.08 TRINITY_DN367_c0_g1_i1:373-1599(-)